MFQRYQRCPWEIEGKPEDEEDGEEQFTVEVAYPLNSRTDSPPRVKFSDKYDVVSRFLSKSASEKVPSMQHDRTEDERLTLPSSTTRQ